MSAENSANSHLGGCRRREGLRALQHVLYRAAKADPEGGFVAAGASVYREDVLWRAWIAVRWNNGAPGIDKTTLAEVEEYGVSRLLGELAAELQEGAWRPLPARKVLIPKPGSSEKRPLAIAAVRGCACHTVGARHVGAAGLCESASWRQVHSSSWGSSLPISRASGDAPGSATADGYLPRQLRHDGASAGPACGWWITGSVPWPPRRPGRLGLPGRQRPVPGRPRRLALG